MQLRRRRPLHRSLFLLVLAILMGPSVASAQRPADSSSVVASVGDTRIFSAELDDWWQRHDPAAYQRARREAYEGRRRALDALLADRLLDAEAVSKGVTVAELLDREVTRRTRVVTDADISTFVSTNPIPAGAPASVVASLVAALLHEQARERAKEEFLTSLRLEPAARVEVLMEPPRVSLSRAAHNPTRGVATAPVEITVFSDFECPFCRRAEPALARLLERFPTEVFLVWRHYPLLIHQDARPAAEAAQCAHDQDMFWAYHDALFADAASLKPNGLHATAVRLGLDAVLFAQCVADDVHEADVEADFDAGQHAGVSGTPTVFIDGVALVGALPYEAYERAVLDALARGADSGRRRTRALAAQP